MAKILVVDDEPSIVNLVAAYLKPEGYEIHTASDGPSGLKAARAFKPDLIILDIMLPGIDGFEVCRELRREMNVPIMFLSARDDEFDRVIGLEIGGDDYISKPFHLAELNSRIKSLARRRHYEGSNEIVFNEIKINVESNEVSVNGERLDLTKKEYDILLYFMVNRNKLITRESIAEHSWGDSISYADNFDFVYSHIKNLRKKIGQKKGKNYLHNFYGIGYKLSD